MDTFTELDDRNVECRSPPIEDADLHGGAVIGHEHDTVAGSEGGEFIGEGASAGPGSDGPHPDPTEPVGRVVGDGPGRAETDEDDAPGGGDDLDGIGEGILTDAFRKDADRLGGFGDMPGDLTLRLVHERLDGALHPACPGQLDGKLFAQVIEPVETELADGAHDGRVAGARRLGEFERGEVPDTVRVVGHEFGDAHLGGGQFTAVGADAVYQLHVVNTTVLIAKRSGYYLTPDRGYAAPSPSRRPLRR